MEIDSADLVISLAEYDVRHLMVAELPAEVPAFTPSQLISALAKQKSPRLREALIPLFLLNSDFAEFVPAVVATLPPKPAETLRHMYTAAVYLQRFWLSKLKVYLQPFPLLPNYYGEKFYRLPASDSYFGEAGLRILAQQCKEKSGYNWLSLYESLISLVFSQLQMEKFNA